MEMNIKRKEQHTENFCELKPGTVFVDDAGMVCIKTEEIYDEHNDRYNAVTLGDGDWVGFSGYDVVVIPEKCDLEIVW